MPWISLNEALKDFSGGEVSLALAARKGNGEFYSFVMAELSPVPGPHRGLYRVYLNNDIDLDWSSFDFKIRLP